MPAGPDEASPRTFPWGKALLLGALFVWLYHYNLQRLWIKTNFITGDPNWSHSLCVPLIGCITCSCGAMNCWPCRCVRCWSCNGRVSAGWAD